MEKGRVFFDVSAYMLFEASGDSDHLAGHHDGALEVGDSDTAEEEDDAQSCSYGSVSDCARLREINVIADDSYGAGFYDCDGEEAVVNDDEDSGAGAQEEDGVVDQCRGGGKAATPKEMLGKSKGGDESSNAKLINERERDRRFWEACLAS